MGTIRFNACVRYALTIINFFAVPLRQLNDSYTMFPGAGGASNKSSSRFRSTPLASPNASAPERYVGAMATGSASGGASRPFVMSVRFKQLELVLFAEPTEKHSRVLVLKVNILRVAWGFFSSFIHLLQQ